MRAKGKPYIALACLCLIVCIMFVMPYLQQSKKQAELSYEIDVYNGVLGKKLEGDGILQAKLEEAEAELLAAQNSFAVELNGTAILEAVLEAATQSEVDVVSTSGGTVREREVGESTYTVASIDLQATGSYAQLLAFLGRLEQGTLDTLVLEQVSMAEGGDSFVAQIGFSVYSLSLCPQEPSPPAPAADQ